MAGQTVKEHEPLHEIFPTARTLVEGPAQTPSAEEAGVRLSVEPCRSLLRKN